MIKNAAWAALEARLLALLALLVQGLCQAAEMPRGNKPRERGHEAANHHGFGWYSEFQSDGGLTHVTQKKSLETLWRQQFCFCFHHLDQDAVCLSAPVLTHSLRYRGRLENC